LANKAQAIKDTWGKRCNRLLFIADENNNIFPTVGFKTIEGKLNMVTRIFNAFDYVYEHYFDDADWFLRSDDDTYVIMENLRYLLASYNASDKWYLGAAYNFGTKQGFNSGGASFVLSVAALRTLYNRPRDKCKLQHRTVGRDDLVLGICLYELGVNISDTRDVMNRTRNLVTRRDFIYSSLLTAGGLTLAPMMPACSAVLSSAMFCRPEDAGTMRMP